MILMKVLNNKAKNIDIYFHFFCLKKTKTEHLCLHGGKGLT